MSRDAILGAIRRGLRRGGDDPIASANVATRLRSPPRHLRPGRATLPRPALIDQFVRFVEKEHGTVDRLGGVAAVPEAVARYLARQNLPPVLAVAPHAALAALPWHERPLLSVASRRAEPLDSASLQHGFAGVAETGTLMLPSGAERPTTLNLLPDTAIVVLEASRIVGALEDAWAFLRAEYDDARTSGFMPRNVMLVTGPSRSADIEQTLELGAHGPRRLHVLLIEDAVA